MSDKQLIGFVVRTLVLLKHRTEVLTTNLETNFLEGLKSERSNLETNFLEGLKSERSNLETNFLEGL
ncbi:hypothetical protein C7B67_27445, partial [filamentous cyanobacterium Phorm 6]